jgi:hypothetical protein
VSAAAGALPVSDRASVGFALPASCAITRLLATVTTSSNPATTPARSANPIHRAPHAAESRGELHSSPAFAACGLWDDAHIAPRHSLMAILL